MIELQLYREYSAPVSPWIGAVPAHWKTSRLGALIKPRNLRNQPALPLLSVARERGVFVRSKNDENHNAIPDDLSNYKVAHAGDLVINKMKAWQGSMGLAPCDGIVSPAYFVFDFHIQNRAYGQKLFRSKPYVAHFGQASDGVRIGQWDLSVPGMKQIPVVLPPEEEQAAIVRYLDWACGRLDRAIRAKRKVIALLNEQKQGIILRTVTRGLNPDCALKPTEIEWLPLIPKHWDVVRNMALFSQRVESGVEGLPVLQVSLHSGVTASEVDQFGRPKKLISDVSKYKIVRKNDLAYNTMRMWQGAVGVVPDDGLVSPAYVVLKPRESVHSEFYNLLFRTGAYKQYINRFSTGIVSDRNRLYWDNFKQLASLRLPLQEQVAIVDAVFSETSGLDRTVDRIEGEIALLREYRTRLIADVVTGKVDVRVAAAGLPVEEPVAEEELSPDEDMQDDEGMEPEG